MGRTEGSWKAGMRKSCRNQNPTRKSKCAIYAFTSFHLLYADYIIVLPLHGGSFVMHPKTSKGGKKV